MEGHGLTLTASTRFDDLADEGEEDDVFATVSYQRLGQSQFRPETVVVKDAAETTLQGQPMKCDGPVLVSFAVGGKGGLRPATYYYHSDHLGSTAWVTDAAGRVYERLEYFPYGEVWRDGKQQDEPATASPTQTFLFTGKEYDEETGLSYFGARYYDSKKARWLSTDPVMVHIEVPPSFSSYAYAWQNPIKHLDPDGRDVYVMVWGPRPGEFGHAAIAVTKPSSADWSDAGARPAHRDTVLFGLFPASSTQMTRARIGLGGAVPSTGEPEKSINESAISTYASREGRAPDGVVVLRTTPAQDKAVIEAATKVQSADYSPSNNCTDACKSALAPLGYDSGKGREVKTFKIGIEKKVNLSTPRALFESLAHPARRIETGLDPSIQVDVVKDPGSRIQGPMPNEVQ